MKVRKILGLCVICSGCICALFVLWVLFMMGGSDYTTYPEEKASLWVCEDPYFEISYVSGTQISYIDWEDKKYEVFVGMRSSVFDVFLKPNNGALENILLRGNWKYKGENMVVKIEKDNLFDGAYEELIFVPQK